MSEQTSQASRSSALGAAARLFCAAFVFVFVPALAMHLWARIVGADAEQLAKEAPVQMGAMSVGALALAWLARAMPPGPSFLPLRPVAVVLRFVPFYLAWALFAVACMALLRALGVAVDAQTTLVHMQQQGIDNLGGIVAVLGVVVFGPLAEEILFRGYLQELCVACVGERAGIAATAVMFGVVHGIGYALPIAVFGWFLCDLRRRHGSILAPWLAHAIFNAISVCFVVFWPDFLDWMYPR